MDHETAEIWPLLSNRTSLVKLPRVSEIRRSREMTDHRRIRGTNENYLDNLREKSWTSGRIEKTLFFFQMRGQ
jgi:hypothetical protein